MKGSFVPAVILVAVLTLGACGSDAVDTSTSDQGPVIAEAEPTGVDPADAGNDDLLTRLWVKPDLVDCIGEMEQQCIQIPETEDGEWIGTPRSQRQ
jgi:hypothetical protein